MLFSAIAMAERVGLREKEEKGGDNCSEHQQCDCHCRPAHVGAMFLNRLQLARQLRITNLIGVKVGHAHPHTVFHFESADVVQEWSPLVRTPPDPRPHDGTEECARRRHNPSLVGPG